MDAGGSQLSVVVYWIHDIQRYELEEVNSNISKTENIPHY